MTDKQGWDLRSEKDQARISREPLRVIMESSSQGIGILSLQPYLDSRGAEDFCLGWIEGWESPSCPHRVRGELWPRDHASFWPNHTKGVRIKIEAWFPRGQPFESRYISFDASLIESLPIR